MKTKGGYFSRLALLAVYMMVSLAVITGCGSKPAEKAVAEEKIDVEGIKLQLEARVNKIAADYNEYVDVYKVYLSSELYKMYNNACEKDYIFTDACVFLDAQDYDKITAEINAIEVKSNTVASVSMCFIDSYYGKFDPITLEFIYENGEWRVDDIVRADGTLRATITNFMNS